LSGKSKSPQSSGNLDGDIASLTQQLAERGFYILGVLPSDQRPVAGDHPGSAGRAGPPVLPISAPET
jgi:hypothetical protein